MQFSPHFYNIVNSGTSLIGHPLRLPWALCQALLLATLSTDFQFSGEVILSISYMPYHNVHVSLFNIFLKYIFRLGLIILEPSGRLVQRAQRSPRDKLWPVSNCQRCMCKGNRNHYWDILHLLRMILIFMFDNVILSSGTICFVS